MNCHYCKNSNDLRPYGPRGAMVCFDCAMSTPARKAETENNFTQQLNASGEFALIDGTETGPYPAKHHPIVKRLLQSNAIGQRGAACGASAAPTGCASNGSEKEE